MDPLFPTIIIMLLPLVTPYIVSDEPVGVMLVQVIPSKLFNTELCSIVGITL